MDRLLHASRGKGGEQHDKLDLIEYMVSATDAETICEDLKLSRDHGTLERVSVLLRFAADGHAYAQSLLDAAILLLSRTPENDPRYTSALDILMRASSSLELAALTKWHHMSSRTADILSSWLLAAIQEKPMPASAPDVLKYLAKKSTTDRLLRQHSRLLPYIKSVHQSIQSRMASASVVQEVFSRVGKFGKWTDAYIFALVNSDIVQLRVVGIRCLSLHLQKVGAEGPWLNQLLGFVEDVPEVRNTTFNELAELIPAISDHVIAQHAAQRIMRWIRQFTHGTFPKQCHKSFGPALYGLFPLCDEKDQDLLLQVYLGHCQAESRKVSTHLLDDFELSGVEHVDDQTHQHSPQYWAAYSLPGIALAWATATSSRSSFSDTYLFRCIRYLQQSGDIDVRIQLARAFHATLQSLESESVSSSSLLDTMSALITDENAEVVGALSQHLDESMPHFRVKERTKLQREFRSCAFGKIPQTLLSELVDTITRQDLSWRTQVAILDQLSANAMDWFESEAVYDLLFPVLQQILISNENPIPVSRAAISCYIACSNEIESSKRRLTLVQWIGANIGTSHVASHRALFVRYCEELLPHVAQQFFRKHLLRHVCRLCSDEFLAVRRASAKLLPIVKTSIVLPRDRTAMLAIEGAANDLQKGHCADKDWATFVNDIHTQLDEIECAIHFGESDPAREKYNDSMLQVKVESTPTSAAHPREAVSQKRVSFLSLSPLQIASLGDPDLEDEKLRRSSTLNSRTQTRRRRSSLLLEDHVGVHDREAPKALSELLDYTTQKSLRRVSSTSSVNSGKSFLPNISPRKNSKPMVDTVKSVRDKQQTERASRRPQAPTLKGSPIKSKSTLFDAPASSKPVPLPRSSRSLPTLRIKRTRSISKRITSGL
eukprot:m.111552 g.111552  ORF g.111552 m.111552 type:complete len:888 (+) comp13450_c0_seq6:251-2914(+)